LEKCSTKSNKIILNLKQITMKYNEKYHNNKLNFLLSINSDRLRTIMDIDTLITKYNTKYTFIIDHKNKNDKCSINLYKQLSNLSNIKLNDNSIIKCFIVKSEIKIDDNFLNAKTINGISYIQEIKNNKYGKEPKDFIENEYNITNDKFLVDFFKPEKHDLTKLKISAYEQLKCF
tara:strand:- start:966 stop:1490 length:525 start_codon:yes stop_codon:yes gene_type:complete